MQGRTAGSVRIHEFGGPEVLRIEPVLVPAPRPNQVRLAIHAIGLNRTEVTLSLGRSLAKPSLPTSIGFEAAGLIEAVGPGVADWKSETAASKLKSSTCLAIFGCVVAPSPL